MSLSRFPTDIISQLANHLVFTDLVLLHACGDSFLNAKMRTAPIVVRVLTFRCALYYNRKLTDRFSNILEVSNVITGIQISNDLNHIPETVIVFRTSWNLACVVPKGVERVVANMITKDASFERGAGELDVSVAVARGEKCGDISYVTELRDHSQYDKSMVNLRKSCMIGSLFFGDLPYPSIDGVKFSQKPAICKHKLGHSYGYRENGKLWVTSCDICKKDLDVSVRSETECPPLPPSEFISLSLDDIDRVKLTLKMMNPETEEIEIYEELDKVNEFSTSGCFDFIPTSVKLVSIVIRAPEKSMNFVGVSKAYPFTVRIQCTKEDLQIDDYTGIDECDWTMFSSDKKRNEILRKHHRLSPVF